MALNVKLIKNTQINAKMNKTNNILKAYSPITLKNQIQEQNIITNIETIQDVSVINASDGTTIVNNANNKLYEVKQLKIDGGVF